MALELLVIAYDHERREKTIADQQRMLLQAHQLHEQALDIAPCATFT